MAMVARTVMLSALIPEGMPTREHFTIAESPAPVAENLGDVLLQVLAMSADPYLRSGCKTGEVPRPMTGFCAGKVIASKNADWPVGSLMGVASAFSTLQVLSAKALSRTISWNLSDVITEEQISLGVGVLGMPGATAYGGLIDVLRPKAPKEGEAGETLFVSAAAGAVGGLVGQIAKTQYNCTVIGSCGGAAKNALIVEKYGFDKAIDYKSIDSSLPREEQRAALVAKLREAAPKTNKGEHGGIDMYFENVGGIHFEAAMETLNDHGRVAVCGAISEYNYGGNGLTGTAPKNEIKISTMIYSFQRIEGFVCMPWLSGARGTFLKHMSTWVKAGDIKVEETFFDGVEAWPDAFAALFKQSKEGGSNTGKVVVRTHDSSKQEL